MASVVAADLAPVAEVQVAAGKQLITFVMLYFILALTAFAQTQPSQSDTLRATLDPVYVTVGRNFTLDQQTPFSVSVTRRTELDRITGTATGTESLLSRTAGVFVANRENYSLGERLSARGSGWRSSFGVRGVQVLVDGLPLTSPDGQTILELVDPNLVRETQVIRGPSAVFWGNGSGGTLYFNTNSIPGDPTLTVRSSIGSYGLMQNDATFRNTFGKNSIQFSISDFRTDGYREHSQAHITRVNLGVRHDLDRNQSLRYQLFAINAPDLKNPGSLNANEFESNPSGANPQFITQNAGKAYQHLVHGLTYSRNLTNSSFESVVYNTFRALENPISPSIIEIDRVNIGTRNSFQYRLDQLRISVSADAAYQTDDRKNWVNIAGNKGNLTVDQIETVGSLGLALIGQYSAGNLTITSGLRSDWLYFEADDKFGGVDDASGNRWMSALSPQIGLTYQVGLTTIYSGVTTSFESPTTTELVNRPDLSRGFNPDLDPERSLGVEFGVRGQFLRPNLDYDVAAFRVNVRDRLSSFQTQAGGDRTFFENIGSTVQQGVEAMIGWQPDSQNEFTATYTLSDFTFDESDRPNDGNKLPGIPAHALRLQGKTSLPGIIDLRADWAYNSKVYTNNSNAVFADAFNVLNIGVSREIRLTGKSVIVPYLNVRNVTDQRYSASVSINAFGGRFFEPGLPRNVVLGISLLLD